MSAEPSLPFVSRATHNRGGSYREGYVVFARDVAGFVPTSDWKSVVGEVALGLLTTKIELSRSEPRFQDSPQLPDELRRLTASRGGFMLADDCTWHPFDVLTRRAIVIRHGSEVVRAEEPPVAALARWREVAVPKKTPVAVIGIMGGLAALCTIVGAVAWHFTGETDYLVAGISFTVIIALILAGVVFGLRRMQSRSGVRSQ